MKLRHLELAGFRSFATTARFDFTSRPAGLYFLTGRNDAEPELGPNGAGKSSLLEGIQWVLFGRTSRKLRASAVHTWGDKGSTAGVLEFDYGDASHVIRRSWNPNALTLDDEPIEQEALEERFRLDPTAFQQQVMIGQFSGMFLDLPPNAKLDMFTSALGLDVWLRASAAARDHGTAARDRATKIERVIAGLEGQASELESQYDKMRERSQNYIDERKKARDVLRAELGDAEDAVERHEYAISECRDKLEAAEDAVDILTGQRDRLQKRRDDKASSLTSYREEIAGCRGRIGSYEAEIAKLSGVTDQCPYCLQPVSLEHLAVELKQRRDMVAREQAILDRVAAEQRKINDEISVIDLEIVDARADLMGAQTETETLRRDRDRAQTLIEPARRAVEKAAARLTEHDAAAGDNPYKNLANEAARKLDDVDDKIEKARTDLADAERDVESATFWHKGFREIRLMLVDRALREIEVEANNCLDTLGLVGWELAFAVESETKSGKVTRGLTSSVFSPHNDEAVPFECWSGGESQRLRLAATMGLVNVLLSRSDIHCNVEFWDEPTQHLSPEGVDALLECLAARAEAHHKQIWLVDHRSLSFGGFKSVVTVVKDASGSRIEEERT